MSGVLVGPPSGEEKLIYYSSDGITWQPAITGWSFPYKKDTSRANYNNELYKIAYAYGA
jgi:hypothetical protein